MRRPAAAVLVALLASVSRAAPPAPVLDPADLGSWELVSPADAAAGPGSLCPSSAAGLVPAVRLRAEPVTVYCLSAGGRLEPSGYELGPGAPKLFVRGFGPQISYPARLEPLLRGPSFPDRAACLEPSSRLITASDAGCRDALNVQRVAAAVRQAARLSPSEARLVIFSLRAEDAAAARGSAGRRVNALFRPGAVSFNDAFMTLFGADDDAIAYVSAHEFGHHWQDRRGRLNPEHRDLERQRAVEAEADSYAWEILRLAGYDLDAARGGQKRMFAATGTGGGRSHPLHDDRVYSADAETLLPSRAVDGSVVRAPEPRVPQSAVDRRGRAMVMPVALPAGPDDWAR